MEQNTGNITTPGAAPNASEANKRPYADDYKGIRANLIGEDDRMETLLLPRVAEGKFFFVKESSGAQIQFVAIEAANDAWLISCDADTCFVGDYSVDTRKIPLECKRLYYINHSGHRYLLCAEMVTTASSVFHNYTVRPDTVLFIGREATNDIVSAGRFVSRKHAALRYARSGGWQIHDQGSANGVFVNNRRVTDAELHLGDAVYLMGLRIIIGTDFISVCSGDSEMHTNPAALQPMHGSRARGAAAGAPKQKLFNRIPRSCYSMEWQPIAVDAPPMPMSSNKMPLILRMGSSAVMGGRSILMGSYSMALTSLVFPFLTQRYTEKERKEYEERRIEKYGEYLAQKKQEITDECVHEYNVLNENYPDLNTALGFSDDGRRLWERRKTDEDFLTLRIGQGTIEMQAELERQERRFEMEHDKLEEQMFDLVQKRYLIEHAPIMLSLTTDYICGVVGYRPAVLQFVRALAAQLVTTHSYDEVKCVFLVEEAELEVLNEMRYLPHLWDDEHNIRFLATNQPSASAISEYLNRDLDGAFKSDGDILKYKKTHPYYVIFALSKRLYDSVEALKSVLLEEKFVGFSVIAAFDELPKESTRVFQMVKPAAGAAGEHLSFDLRRPDVPPQKFRLDELEPGRYNRCMKKLANISLKTVAGSFSLPKTFTFLEMFGVGKIEHLNLLSRWAESDPTRSLATPVGIGTDGELFMLDLHEKRQGPHGLVAGMTGSGKSEFIITYILSMAVNFSPDEVAFVLIDYKGGGLAGAFEDEERGIHLPHLVGTITNLDGAAITRSMISIESELKRRQRIFNEAKTRCNEGTMDIYDYQRLYRAKRVSEPLPHLFIISDEFAELKSQQPDFMDKLISTARIGRSLGVHLILATQKPAGVVNDQIWSNTKFRVCLRVQDKIDSQDMLKRPEAAELKDTGRFYLQVGYNEYFALGQSAWCGADYIPHDEVVSQRDENVHVIDDTAQTTFLAKPVHKENKAVAKQIVAVVQYLSELAKREHLIPRTLLPPPLPKTLTMAQLQGRFDDKTPQSISALVGMIDDPAYQTQYPFELDLQSTHNTLIVGESGCGKTVFVQTMLLSLAQRYTPEQVNFYILDFSSKLLNKFMRLPHCGAVLTDDDEPAIDRLFDMITEETRRRQNLFAKAEVNSYEAYCRIKQLPLWVVVIDGIVNFTSIKRGNYYYSSIHNYMRDGANYGIKFILAGSHYNQFSMQVRQEASCHIGMNLNDRYAYFDVMGCKTDYLPPCLPGRGMNIWDGRPLEFQGAIFSVDEDQQLAAKQLEALLQSIAERDAQYEPAKRLVMLSDTEEYADFAKQFGAHRIPLGYTLDSIKPVAIPLKQMFTLSLYFGNITGMAPVLQNLMQVFCAESMELVIVKRRVNSLFENGSEMLAMLQNKTQVSVIDTSSDELDKLQDRLLDEMQKRSELKKEFVEQKHLTEDDPDNAIRAFDYINEHAKPLMVVFENYCEFAKKLNVSQVLYFSALFSAESDNDDNSAESLKRRGRGYGIYYTGCFLPGDGIKVNTQSEVGACFNPQKFTLMFGGQLSKSGLVPLPREYMAITQPNEKYNRFLMWYNDKPVGMSMPCGVLLKTNVDPDEQPIV